MANAIKEIVSLVHSFLMLELVPLPPTVCLQMTTCASCVSFNAYIACIINVDLVFLRDVVQASQRRVLQAYYQVLARHFDLGIG